MVGAAFSVDLRRHVGREDIVRLVMEQHRWSPAQGDPYAFLCDCLSDAAGLAQVHALTLVRLFEALPVAVLRRWVRAVSGRASGDKASLVYSLVAVYAHLREGDEPSAAGAPWWHEVAERLATRSARRLLRQR
jgi:hypothetical protein